MLLLIGYLIGWLVTSGLVMSEFGGDSVSGRDFIAALLMGLMWPMILPLLVAARYYERKSDG